MLKAVFVDFGNTLFPEGAPLVDKLAQGIIDLMPGAREALQGIALPKGIWANTRESASVHIARWLTAADLHHNVQWIATSAELGYRKPDPEFFRRALAQAGLQASEALFVGNQLNTDILGGQQAGIQTVYLSDPIYRSVDDADTPAALPTHAIPTLFDLPVLVTELMRYE